MPRPTSDSAGHRRRRSLDAPSACGATVRSAGAGPLLANCRSAAAAGSCAAVARGQQRAIRIRSRRGTRCHRGHNEPCCPPQGRSTRCRRTAPGGIWSRRPRVVRSARNGARQRARYRNACRGRSGCSRPPPGVRERRSMTDTTVRRPRRLMAPRAPAPRRRQAQDVARSATVSDAGERDVVGARWCAP